MYVYVLRHGTFVYHCAHDQLRGVTLSRAAFVNRQDHPNVGVHALLKQENH